jgi:hypothetical protein
MHCYSEKSSTNFNDSAKILYTGCQLSHRHTTRRFINAPKKNKKNSRAHTRKSIGRLLGRKTEPGE